MNWITKIFKGSGINSDSTFSPKSTATTGNTAGPVFRINSLKISAAPDALNLLYLHLTNPSTLNDLLVPSSLSQEGAIFITLEDPQGTITTVISCVPKPTPEKSGATTLGEQCHA